jgi:hypothetical protein
LIAGLQILTIVVTGGDVILLGEAYAFGVIWSLPLKSLSMLMLRFQEPERFREYRVPINKLDRELMTAVIDRAERAGKPVSAAILTSDDPLDAVVRAACDLNVIELMIAPSATEAPIAWLDTVEARWRQMCDGLSRPGSVRMIGKDVDLRRANAAANAVPTAPDDDGETARAFTETTTA